MDLPVRAIHRQIVGAIQVIVQVARLPEGRRVTHITEVRGLDDDTGDLVLEDVFRLSAERGPAGRADLCLSGYLPSFIDEITAGGRVALAQLY
jgi:pilus assembly protein CpaF